MDRPQPASYVETESPGRVLVSASIAYDLIMTFPGSFQDYILPDKAHVLSVSFLFDSLVRRRGGIAGNIAYSLALLGERPMLVGAGGSDFREYRAAFEAVGVDMSLVLDVQDVLTGSSYMMSDRVGNQIAGFYPGASDRATAISLSEPAKAATLGIVSATSLDVMRQHAHEIASSGCKLIYDPSQQVVGASADDLAAGIDLAWGIIGSDYEHAIIEKKTGRNVANLREQVPLVVVTYGGEGSRIYVDGQEHVVPIVPADPLVEVTGGGDGYRAGLIKGYLLGLDWPIAGRMAALAATYAIEHQGTQEHEYTADGFIERFDRVFPDFAGAVSPQHLAPAVATG